MSFYRGTGDVDSGSEAGRVLKSQNNLSDVANVTTARTNLGLESAGAVDSANVTFIQSGTGAVARTLQDEARERVSVTQFGAVGDWDGVAGTDDTAAIQLAINALPASGGEVHFPVTITSKYLVSSKPNAGTKKCLFVFHGNSDLSSSAFYPTGTNVFGFRQAGTETSFSETRIVSDTVDQISIAGSKVNGHKVLHAFGDSSTTGGRHGIYGVLTQNAATSTLNTDRNYVGIQGQCITETGDGGTDLAAGAKGAYFGISAIVNANSGAINISNLTAAELNTRMLSGSSVKYKSVLQLVPKDEIQGTTYDALLALSRGGSGTVGMKTGILFGAMNGSHPVDAAGSLIETSGSATVVNGLDFSSYEFSGYVLKAPRVLLKDTNLSLSGAGASLELGSLSASNTPFIDFHSSGNNIDNDARISASGGTASPSEGVLTYLAQAHVFSTVISGASGAAFRVAANANAVNYIQVIGATAGGAGPQVQADGTDTNIDLRLAPKGTGLIRFGTWTSNADAPVNGYVTIKDSGGTTRKLATIA